MTATPTNLSGIRADNWTPPKDWPPTVVVNMDAKLHSCIAWAWGEVYEASELTMAAMAAEPHDALRLIELIHSRVEGARTMLSTLGGLTRKDPRTLVDLQDALNRAERGL